MKHKKLFAILTLVCFMFTLMPVAAMAEGEAVASVTTTGGVTTTHSSLNVAFTNANDGDEIKILKEWKRAE